MVSTAQWRVAAVVAAAILFVVILTIAWPSESAPPSLSKSALQQQRSDADAVSSGAVSAPDVDAPQQREPQRRVAIELPLPESAATDSGITEVGVADPSLLTGHVRLESGDAAVGARVRIGKAVCVTDTGGAFAFSRKSIRSGDALVATMTGQQPAVVAAVVETAAFRNGSDLDVVLPGRAWTIDGWLVDDLGAPCQGWKIELYRGTACGAISWPNVLAEDLAAGAEVSAVSALGEGHAPLDRPSPTSNPNLQILDSDGAFRIGGLCKDRDYVLRAWNTDTLTTVISSAIPSGTSRYVFTVPAATCRDRVWGRTLDHHGVPIAGVRVRLTMIEHQVESWSCYRTGQTVTTAVDGSYEFRQVPRQDLLLRFDSPEVVGRNHELKAADSGADLETRLACTCHFHYEAGAGAVAATALRILDADEHALRLRRQLGPGRSISTTVSVIEDGRTPVLEVSDAAAWLELRTRNHVLQRVPVQLNRNQPNVLRW